MQLFPENSSPPGSYRRLAQLLEVGGVRMFNTLASAFARTGVTLVNKTVSKSGKIQVVSWTHFLNLGPGPCVFQSR